MHRVAAFKNLIGYSFRNKIKNCLFQRYNFSESQMEKINQPENENLIGCFCFFTFFICGRSFFSFNFNLIVIVREVKSKSNSAFIIEVEKS